MRRRRALRASWAITDDGVWPGASASRTLTDALPGSPAAEFGRLSGTYERTRENLVDTVIELVESDRRLFETGDAAGSAGACRRRPVLATLSGNRVTDQIQLTGRAMGYAAEDSRTCACVASAAVSVCSQPL